MENWFMNNKRNYLKVSSSDEYICVYGSKNSDEIIDFQYISLYNTENLQFLFFISIIISIICLITEILFFINSTHIQNIFHRILF